MASEKHLKSEQEILDQVVKQLVRGGVRSERIFLEKWILQDGVRRCGADIAVVNKKDEVEFVFEIKTGLRTSSEKLLDVKENVLSVVGLCKCYLVSVEEDGIYVARMLPSGSISEWGLLEDFQLISDGGKTSGERKWILAVGLILVAIFVCGESLGAEFSWKIYSLLLLVATLFAAASGYRFSFKAGPDGCALSVGSTKEVVVNE